MVSNGDRNGAVWVSLGSNAAVGTGMQLSPDSPVLILNYPDCGNAPGQDLFAIAQLLGQPSSSPVQNSTVGNGLSGAATGVILSRTVPALRVGQLQSATIVMTTGAPTVRLEIVRSAATIILAQFAASGTFVGPVDLIAGDVYQWDVTTAVGGSVFDATLSEIENVAALSAPGSVNVTLWEFEA
jgi:hypothetical protein